MADQRETLRLGGIALALGTALGLVGRVSDYLQPELVVLFALAAPWLVVAFAAGMAASRPADGARAGALALATSVAVYYALMLLVEQRVSPGYAIAMTVLWGAAAVGCGAVFGALGSRARAESSVAGVLGGALAGEGAVFLLLLGAEGAPGLVFGLELLAGLAVAVIAARARPLPAMSLATAMACVFAVADVVVRAFMRTKGWGA